MPTSITTPSTRQLLVAFGRASRRYSKASRRLREAEIWLSSLRGSLARNILLDLEKRSDHPRIERQYERVRGLQAKAEAELDINWSTRPACFNRRAEERAIAYEVFVRDEEDRRVAAEALAS